MNLLNPYESSMVTVETPFAGWPKAAADGAAANATSETAIALVGPGDVQLAVGTVQIHPAAALTGDPANNATINVFKRMASNQSQVLLATLTTTAVAGNWTAWKAVNVPVQAGAFVAPGDTITVSITKGGTGVVVPQLFLGVYTTKQ